VDILRSIGTVDFGHTSMALLVDDAFSPFNVFWWVFFFFSLQNDEIQHIPIAKQYGFVFYSVTQVIYVKSIH